MRISYAVSLPPLFLVLFHVIHYPKYIFCAPEEIRLKVRGFSSSATLWLKWMDGWGSGIWSGIIIITA